MQLRVMHQGRHDAIHGTVCHAWCQAPSSAAPTRLKEEHLAKLAAQAEVAQLHAAQQAAQKHLAAAQAERLRQGEVVAAAQHANAQLAELQAKLQSAETRCASLWRCAAGLTVLTSVMIRCMKL
jgi:hypothetical protein